MSRPRCGGDGEVWTIQAKTRARAECEAKRRIVDMAVTSSPPSPLVTKGATAVLRCLALPYADHPDYPETRETAPPTSKGERG